MVNWKSHGVPFLDFSEEITQQWIRNGFSKNQTQDWLNIGLKASEADFAKWLEDIKEIDFWWMLNYGDYEKLKAEFMNYLNQQEGIKPLAKNQSSLTPNTNKSILLVVGLLVLVIMWWFNNED